MSHIVLWEYIFFYVCLQCLKAKIKRKKPTGVFSTNVRELTDSEPTSSAETSDHKSTAGCASSSSLKNAVRKVMEQGDQNKHIHLFKASITINIF